MKLIVLLRNPVDRAYSHHQMNVRKGIEPLSFDDAILAEVERLRDSDPDIASGNWRRYSYVGRGMYGEQLARWFETFPREQFLIIKSEDFAAEPKRHFDDVLAFLGLTSCPLPAYRPHNAHEYRELALESRARLAQFYEPYNHELYELLGRDLGWEQPSRD